MNVAAKPVQLGDGNGALELLRGCESGLELRAAVDSVGALAGLNLHELADQLQALILGELPERLALGFDAEA
jgi:hypothetical protein